MNVLRATCVLLTVLVVTAKLVLAAQRPVARVARQHALRARRVQHDVVAEVHRAVLRVRQSDLLQRVLALRVHVLYEKRAAVPTVQELSHAQLVQTVLLAPVAHQRAAAVRANYANATGRHLGVEAAARAGSARDDRGQRRETGAGREVESCAKVHSQQLCMHNEVSMNRRTWLEPL